MEATASQEINGSLEVRVGWNPAEIVTLDPIHGRVCWKGNWTVVHWRLYPSCKVRYPWVIAPGVMYYTGYIQRPLLIKEKFHLWDYSQTPWGRKNKYTMVGIQKDIRAQPPGRILEVELRATLKAYGEERLVN